MASTEQWRGKPATCDQYPRCQHVRAARSACTVGGCVVTPLPSRPRGASSGGAGAQLAPPEPPRWRRIGYRVAVVPIFVLAVYLGILALAYSAYGLVWVIRHA